MATRSDEFAQGGAEVGGIAVQWFARCPSCSGRVMSRATEGEAQPWQGPLERDQWGNEVSVRCDCGSRFYVSSPSVWHWR